MSPELYNYRISSLNIVNPRTPIGEQTVKFSYSFSITEYEDSKYVSTCNAMLRMGAESELSADNENLFSISLIIDGFFIYNEHVDDLNDLGNICAKILLPFVRSHIASAAASIGVPSIIIPTNMMIDAMDKK